jgi:ABC-type sugar transport system ATPase subunit
MNLFEARVEGAAVQADGVRVSLNGHRPPPDGSDIVLGFRPEHVVVADRTAEPADGFEGVLEVDEHVGHERLWYLRVGEREVLVRPRASDSARQGDRVRACVDPAGVRLFDRDTGTAL